MDVSKMKHFKSIDMKDANTLFVEASQAKKSADVLYEAMDNLFTRTQIAELVNNFYDLGKVTEVYEIFGGYVNRSFGVFTEKDGKKSPYFVRKYKSGIEEKEILFEHKLINFAKKNGMQMAAGIFACKNGETFVKLPEEVDGEVVERYFAIYEYLEGEDKYTWIENRLTDGEYASAAGVLANLHNAAKDFDPEGLERVEPKILQFIPSLPPVYREFAKTEGLDNNNFHIFVKENLEEICEVFERTPKYFTKEALATMPVIPVHCDIHPGNLKYENDQAVGIFDFDWAKTDLRLFDVAEALAYFCTSWDPSDDTVRIDKCKIFVQAYQDKLKELGQLPPLSATELELLPHMVAMANLYLINWDVQAFYADTTVNVYEYVAYLRHNFWAMQYIEQHKDELAAMTKSIS